MLLSWTLGRCWRAPEGHPEDLELLLLSFHFPDKFGHTGDVVEDGSVFLWD